MHRSQFNLFRDIGNYLYGNASEALRFAMAKIARPELKIALPADPQLTMALPRTGWRT